MASKFDGLISMVKNAKLPKLHEKPDVDLRMYIPPMPKLEYLPAKIAYICDGKACGDVCPNPECRHTLDVWHAKNFQCNETQYNGGMKQKFYVEEER